MAAEAEAGAGPASAEWEAPTRVLRAFTWLGQEFLSDWEAQDLRAALFQLLLLWLLVSLLGIQVAWRVYGNTVTSLYYRQGPGGQNGETPDGSSHYSMWESTSNTSTKTHRE
ncbi:T-cell leukemia translocation-altered gene protein [Vipera latastei]